MNSSKCRENMIFFIHIQDILFYFDKYGKSRAFKNVSNKSYGIF